jgi:hypothetical protein
MNSGRKDTVALVLVVLGLACAVIELFYKPFLFAPIAFLLLLIGVTISSSRRQFGLVATGIGVVCFVIGAAAAVWSSRALY